MAGEVFSDKQFDNLLNKLNQKFENTIFIGSDRESVRDIRVKFRSPMLNYAFGGAMLGRIVHLFGKQSQGKSSLSTLLAAECQRYYVENGHPEKNKVVYIDFERSFDIDFAENIGLDCDNVIVIRAFNIEDAFTQWEALIKTGRVCCTIFDSDATAPTRNELEDEVNKSNFGAGALAVGRVLRRANIYTYHYKAMFIHISQERAPMGMQKVAYTGGSAPQFYATYQFRISKVQNIEDPTSKETVGIVIRARNFKNKGGTPFRDAVLQFMFKGGLVPEVEYEELFGKAGLITVDSGHYDSDKYNIHVYGAPKFKAWCEANPDVYEQMKKDLDDLLVGNKKIEGLDDGAVDPLSEEERAFIENQGKDLDKALEESDGVVSKETVLADDNVES